MLPKHCRVTTPKAKNRTLRNFDHSFAAAKDHSALNAPLRRCTSMTSPFIGQVIETLAFSVDDSVWSQVYTVGFCPPSTIKLLPVIQAARAEMRNPTISAISCGMPIRRKGIAAVMASGVMPKAFVKSARTTSASGVTTLPGGHRVHAHTMRRYFGSKRLAPRIHCRLGGRIVDHRATRRSERRF